MLKPRKRRRISGLRRHSKSGPGFSVTSDKGDDEGSKGSCCIFKSLLSEPFSDDCTDEKVRHRQGSGFQDRRIKP